MFPHQAVPERQVSAEVMERAPKTTVVHDAEGVRRWARAAAESAPPLSQQQALRLRGLFSGGAAA